MIENEALKFRFRQRLCATLSRLAVLSAVLCLVPLLFRLAVGAVAFGSAVFITCLAILSIASLFLLLLNEDFRALFSTEGVDNAAALSEQVDAFYRIALPVLLVLCAVFAALSIFLAAKNAVQADRRGAILRASFSFAIALLSAVVFFVLSAR